MLIGCT